MKLREILEKSAADFETPLLAFPVTVTCAVALAMLFPGGRCAAWQWWMPAAAAAAFAFARAPSRRRGIAAATSFSAFLALVWLATNATAARQWWDAMRYHCPAIMMLADGWNPVRQGTFGGIFAATGMRAEWMNAYHVIAMPKGPWYFLAAADLFAGNPFNLFLPLYPFLALACVYAVADAFKHEAPWVRAAAAMFVIGYTPGFGCIVDAVVGLAGAGLVATLYSQMRTGRWHWPRLVAFTFWMAVSKQTALLHCCAFWIVFLAVKSALKCRDGYLRKTFTTGAICAALAIPVSVSPYVSSFLDFGHPLYPRCTGNEAKHPAVNITADFLDRNADAAAMGHLGAYVNAYVSDRIAKTYYANKLGRPGFMPECRVWDTPGLPPHTPGSPTSAGARIVFSAAVLALLAFGGAAERFVAVCALAGTALLPTEMLGYMRYTPWLLSLYVFIVPVVSRGLERRGRVRLRFAAGAVFALCVALRFTGEMSRNFADAVKLKRDATQPQTGTVDGCGDKTVRAYAELLRRRTSR